MAGPWDQFQAQPAVSSKPWEQFKAEKPWEQFKATPAQTAPAKDPKGRELLPSGQLPTGTELLTTPQGRHNIWSAIKQEPGRILGGMIETAKKPGEIMKSEKPVTTGEMIEPAADIAMMAAPGARFGIGKATGIEPLRRPEQGPSREFVQAQENALFKIVQESEADKVDILKKTEALPEEVKNPVMQEKFYHHIEGEPLKEYEKTMFDQTVGLMQTERAQLYNKITEAGYPIEDLTSQVHRVVKGKAPQFDVLAGAEAADPIMGLGRGLPRTTSSLQERKFFALKDEAGNRFVVSKSEAGGTLWHGGKPTQVTIPHEIADGNKFSVGPKKFEVVQATTKEIEENTPVRYYKNAWANTADDVVRLKRVARAIDYLEQLKTTPEWQRFATMDKMKAPPEWRTTKLPQLEGWRMDPKLAAAFDDFYGHGRSDLAEKIAKINRFATRSIFWNPTPHIENVMGHWLVGRGWDWITPQGLRSLFYDGAKAIKSTVTLDKHYQEMLREGSALQLARVANQEFYQQLAKKIGMEFEKDPGRWGNIFKTMGFNGLADGVNGYYNVVSKLLWGANDIFMLQRVAELERKGLSRAMAIKEAEKHIPNYRIPSEIMGSRAWSELMQNPNIFIFNRYHYGVWKSYANMVKDMYQGSPKEKVDALGNMVALGVLSFVIYPYISAGLQKLLGEPEAKKLARGPAAIPTAIQELWSGDRTLNAFISGVMTMAPGTKEVGEQMSTYDWFTGRHIVEPDDVKNHRWGRVAAQIVNHAAETMVSPYNVLDQYIKDKDAKSAVREMIDQITGIKEPTERQIRGKKAAQAIQAKEAAKRAAKPRGLIEELPKYGGPNQ